MAVDFDLFQEWAVNYFGEANIKLRNTKHGVEICANSIWSEAKIGKIDRKFHLWMSPNGGKSKHPEFGSYRCWLTDRMGSLIGLVAELDNLDWEEAENRICGSSSLRSLELKVHELFGHKEEMSELEVVESIKQTTIELPPSSFLIDKMNSGHYMKSRARQYLAKRKIPTTGLYVCVAGDYANRIIIPYYNAEGELIFYNGRLMSDKKDVLRYLKCNSDIVRQEDVLYMTDWPKPRTKIYIMEGELDAITLHLCGLVGCACGGKYMSDAQVEMIRQYEPVLAFDADDAGLKAMIDIGNVLLEKGFPKVSYVRPPALYKDWNKLLVERNSDVVVGYLNKYLKNFTSDTPAILLANRL